MNNFNDSSSSNESVSEDETQPKHNLRNKLKANNSLIKEPKLVTIFNLEDPTKIEIKKKTISPFKNNIDLSFAQRDKYIFELGWFLKKTYGDTFKDDWCYFKEQANKNINGEDEWNTIDPDNLYQDNFDLDVHEFALKIMSKVFPKFKQLFNEYKPSYEIKNKIKYFTSYYTIYDLIKDNIENKFFINKDNTSYIYDEQTRLYTFNSNLDNTMKSLNTILESLKYKIEKLLLFVSYDYNLRILKSFIENIDCSTIQNKLFDVIKKNHINTIIFNNNKTGEIPFDKYVLNFKTQEIKERTYLDYYTTTVNANYLKNYNHIPEYIKSVFGKDKNKLKQIQTLLGSLITGCEQDKFVLFYGTGANSKSKLLYALKDILNDFQFNIDYEQYNKEKNSYELINKLGFEKKRIIGIDDIDYKTFLKDESYFRRLVTNNKFNFIGTTNVKPIVSDNIAMKRRLIVLNFENVFIETPERENEKQVIRDLNINYDFLFTWLVKGAIAYMETYKDHKKISKIEIEAKRIYDLDQTFDTESEDESKDESKDEFKCGIKTNFISLEERIITFVKNHTIESPSDRINKKFLYNMYCNKDDCYDCDYKQFNKIIRNLLKFKEKQSNNVFYWLGYRLL
ncbi:hypothetical protein Yalta_175 [Yalta virus]|nr:hypothetical protein Yalta_003 [Yalta virus]QKE44622.1 hypothetical protein Yalta_175 [Yalta virus]